MPLSGRRAHEEIGLENVRLFETHGNPIRLRRVAERAGRTHDSLLRSLRRAAGGSRGPLESPPFEATVRENEIYARGAADDKGQVFMHFKAIEAHLKQAGRLPLNIKVFLEGEEEVGSLHLDEFVRQNKPLLAADVVVISDSAMFARDIPSICYGLRGLVYYQIDLRGTKSDLHSGVFGGARAILRWCCRDWSQMKDKSGGQDQRILRRRARSVGEERAEWKSAFDEKKVDAGMGPPRWRGRGYSGLEVLGRGHVRREGLLSGSGRGPKTVLRRGMRRSHGL